MKIVDVKVDTFRYRRSPACRGQTLGELAAPLRARRNQIPSRQSQIRIRLAPSLGSIWMIECPRFSHQPRAR